MDAYALGDGMPVQKGFAGRISSTYVYSDFAAVAGGPTAPLSTPPLLV